MATTPQAPKFRKLRQVTLPVLKMVSGKSRFVCFIGPMHIGAALESRNSDPDKKKKEPATIAHCLDMETGEEGTLICATMLRGELEKEYANHSYVGRGFEISQSRTPDRDYNIVTIVEVSVPDDVANAVGAIRKSLGEAMRAAKQASAAAASDAGETSKASAATA